MSPFHGINYTFQSIVPGTLIASTHPIMTINEVTPASKAEYDESQKSLLPTTDLPYLDARHSTCEDSLANDITDGLKMAGGCVVRGLVSGQKIDQINTELAPHLKQYGKINSKSHKESNLFEDG